MLLRLATACRSAAPLLCIAWAAGAAAQQPAGSTLPVAMANSNTAAAGTSADGTLRVSLVARRATWHPEADDGPSLAIEAFGEEGRRPSIPGPLLRARVGTVLDVSVRNSLPDTLLVFGILGPAAPADTLRIPPGAEVRSRATLSIAGTYAYGGATIVGDSLHLLGTGNQLLGALIVDEVNAEPDRVFVISIWPPMPGRFVMAMNGKSWPHTERMDVTVGDAVKWRVINGTRGRHPMHLHGFYYRIDSRGAWSADTALADPRPMVVTESIPYRGTYTMTWTAERAGNWLFHCHDALHTTWRRRFNLIGERPPVTLPMDHHAGHAEQDMSGLVIGIRARNRDGSATMAAIPPARHHARIAVNEKAGHYAQEPGFSYIQSPGAAAPLDSLEIPARPLVLTRGVPTAITVVNRMSIATALHWHGIELESFHDGVAGWSGDGITTAPVIAPQDSFVVRMTPPRAGTFMFHAHVDDMRQMALGLYGPLIVLPPGEPFDPQRDHVFMLSQMGRGRTAVMGVNGSATPAPLSFEAGVPHRMRFINISIEADATFTLSADSSVVSWRALAKDGADLPPSRALTGPATLVIAPGETYDFEVSLQPGVHRLAIESFQDIDVVINALAPAPPAARTRRAVPGRIAFTRVREDVTRPGDYRVEAEIWVMNGDGSDARRLTFDTSDDFGIAWSPDGSRMMFGENQFMPDSSGALVPVDNALYLIDPAGGSPVRITPAGMKAQFPSWSPDGSRILFHGSRLGSRGVNDIFVMHADGSNITQLTPTDAAVDARPEWSPDGRRIAFQSNRDGSIEIHAMNTDGSNAVQLTHDAPGTTNMAPAWSPDGKRLLFRSNRDGNFEVYVMNPDGSGRTRLTHDPADDGDPEWADDGRLILFDRDVSYGDKDVPQLWVMNADGTGISALTDLPSSSSHAAWTGTMAAPASSPVRAATNDNRTSAGVLRDGVLTLDLEIRSATWYPEAEDGPFKVVAAFAEAGRAPSVPGPLIRVPLGTTVTSSVRNHLADTVAVLGLAGRADTTLIAPGQSARFSYTPAAAGSFLYGAAEREEGSIRFGGITGQLAGAFIVDDGASDADRIFIATSWDPVPIAGNPHFLAMNGKSWPFTEKFEHTVGDTVRWRVLNGGDGSSSDHPMHLHGFYYRVDARGGWSMDTSYTAAERRWVVTENLPGLSSMRMTWIPERAGNWLFHCHNADHVAGIHRHSVAGITPPTPQAPVHDAKDHLAWDMSGLAHAITVHPRAGEPAAALVAAGEAPRHLRLLAQLRPGYFGNSPGFGYVLQSDDMAPAPDSVMIPGPQLDLEQGKPVGITVINRLRVHTAVHWHGIELESFYDGVAGWSGAGDQLAPMIAPGDSFVVRFTPPRAGTFIYHAHMTDRVQLARGLYGALIVRPASTPRTAPDDRVVLVSFGRPGGVPGLLVNGSNTPAPILVGAAGARLRVINIATENNVIITIDGGSAPVTWTMVAKDGFDEPRARQVSAPARLHIFPGETYDFEVPAPAEPLTILIRNPDSGQEIRLPVHPAPTSGN